MFEVKIRQRDVRCATIPVEDEVTNLVSLIIRIKRRRQEKSAYSCSTRFDLNGHLLEPI